MTILEAYGSPVPAEKTKCVDDNTKLADDSDTDNLTLILINVGLLVPIYGVSWIAETAIELSLKILIGVPVFLFGLIISEITSQSVD